MKTRLEQGASKEVVQTPCTLQPLFVDSFHGAVNNVHHDAHKYQHQREKKPQEGNVILNDEMQRKGGFPEWKNGKVNWEPNSAHRRSPRPPMIAPHQRKKLKNLKNTFQSDQGCWPYMIEDEENWKKDESVAILNHLSSHQLTLNGMALCL